MHMTAEEKQFQELYTSYAAMVYNLAVSYLQNVEDAEEITQDVFLQVHQSLEKFKHKSTLKTWIFRITINKCLDQLKARKRKKRMAFVSSLFHPDGQIVLEAIEFNHPGILLEQKENAATLFECIDELPQNQKTAFLLSKVECLPNAEISEIMEASMSSVESYLFRAKQNLQALILKKTPSMHTNNQKTTSKKI
jgi:RNA polymerase sigma factor (sigma-70 family)